MEGSDMLSLLCQRQVTSCALSTGIRDKISALVKKRKREKVKFVTILKYNPDLYHHIVLGFTANGEHLLSCTTDVEEGFGEVEEEEPGNIFSMPLGCCRLHWWRLPLKGYAMTKVWELSIFEDCTYSNGHCLDILEVPRTDWIVAHSWVLADTADSHHLYSSSTRTLTDDVRCAVSIIQNPLRTTNHHHRRHRQHHCRPFEIVLLYSKALTTPPVPLPLSLGLPGCVILDLTHCVCVVCYDDHDLCRAWDSLSCSGQDWLTTGTRTYSSSCCCCSGSSGGSGADDGITAWETMTMTVHIRGSKHCSGSGGDDNNCTCVPKPSPLACNNGGVPIDSPTNPTMSTPHCIGQQPHCIGQQPRCIGQQPHCIGQQVLDVEKWLVSELSGCPEVRSIGFYFILDYTVHVKGVCAVSDCVVLSLRTLLSSHDGGKTRCYNLLMEAVWNIRRGLVITKKKVFTKSTASKLPHSPHPTLPSYSASIFFSNSSTSSSSSSSTTTTSSSSSSSSTTTTSSSSSSSSSSTTTTSSSSSSSSFTTSSAFAEGTLFSPSLLDNAHLLYSRAGLGHSFLHSLPVLCHPTRPLEVLLGPYNSLYFP